MYDPSSPANAGEVFLLLPHEGHAVGTLFLRGIALVGTDFNLVQRAIILQITMIGTLTDSTLNGLIGMAVHHSKPPSFDCIHSICRI